jgi:hypothetical protein
MVVDGLFEKGAVILGQWVEIKAVVFGQSDDVGGVGF